MNWSKTLFRQARHFTCKFKDLKSIDIRTIYAIMRTELQVAMVALATFEWPVPPPICCGGLLAGFFLRTLIHSQNRQTSSWQWLAQPYE